MTDWLNLPAINIPSGLKSKIRCRPTNQKTADEILLNPTLGSWTCNGEPAGANPHVSYLEFCAIVGGELFVAIRYDEMSQDAHLAFTRFELEIRDEPI